MPLLLIVRSPVGAGDDGWPIRCEIPGRSRDDGKRTGDDGKRTGDDGKRTGDKGMAGIAYRAFEVLTRASPRPML